MSLANSQVDVHAVEPSRAMRGPLMTRLASLPADLRARVTVHPEPLGEAGLRGVADVAVCHNVVACLSPASRRAVAGCRRIACAGGRSFFSSRLIASPVTTSSASFRSNRSAATAREAVSPCPAPGTGFRHASTTG
nr:hypothetical protein [Streptomyces sp. ADI93-02]